MTYGPQVLIIPGNLVLLLPADAGTASNCLKSNDAITLPVEIVLREREYSYLSSPITLLRLKKHSTHTNCPFEKSLFYHFGVFPTLACYGQVFYIAVSVSAIWIAERSPTYLQAQLFFYWRMVGDT